MKFWRLGKFQGQMSKIVFSSRLFRFFTFKEKQHFQEPQVYISNPPTPCNHWSRTRAIAGLGPVQSPICAPSNPRNAPRAIPDLRPAQIPALARKLRGQALSPPLTTAPLSHPQPLSQPQLCNRLSGPPLNSSPHPNYTRRVNPSFHANF